MLNLERLRQDMERVMDSAPELSDFGYGVFSPRSKTSAQRLDELAVDRAKLLDARSLEQFALARSWLSTKPRTTRPNPRACSSYGLKHLAEPDIGYVTNGVFIAAALAEGFKVERISATPNAALNIGRRAVSALQRAQCGAGYGGQPHQFA